MSRPRLDVQLCVLCHTARRYGPHPTWDLLGIDYTQKVSPDAEFPIFVPRLDLFVRFLVANVGPTGIAVRVWRLYDDGTNREKVGKLQTVVPFAPDELVREHTFRLVNVPLTGEGQYAVRMCRRIRHRWKGVRWRVLGADYFFVER